MDKLERTVEREMGLLRELPPVSPRRECVGRIKAAVAREAARAARYHRTLRVLRSGIGVAAAIMLAVGLATMSGLPRPVGWLSSEATLDEWAAAWDESSRRVTSLLDGGWIGDGFGNGLGEDVELDDLFDSLDQSFGHFEDL
ncbi:MAG: hypothetical protein KAY37_12360 [Phycisphaerae bacterium]|nr:hypothetical protein [Phycisphaerae bacterium]